MPVEYTPISGSRIERFHPLGGGVVRPFLRAAHGDVASDQGASEILSNIGQILGTPAGTFPWRPEFGSHLERLRHQSNNLVLRETASVYVRDALERWDSRVKLVKLTAKSTQDNDVQLRAVVQIEGVPGELSFQAVAGRSLQGTAVEEPRTWNIANEGRSTRGLNTLTEPPVRVKSGSKTLLSSGLVRPFVRGRDINNADGVPEILSNVGQVLGTSKGTLPWRPEFGSELHRLRHRANGPVVRETARSYVEDALRRWEPRARATRIEVLDPRLVGENVLTVRVLCGVALVQNGQVAGQRIDIAVK